MRSRLKLAQAIAAILLITNTGCSRAKLDVMYVAEPRPVERVFVIVQRDPLPMLYSSALTTALQEDLAAHVSVVGVCIAHGWDDLAQRCRVARTNADAILVVEPTAIVTPDEIGPLAQYNAEARDEPMIVEHTSELTYDVRLVELGGKRFTWRALVTNEGEPGPSAVKVRAELTADEIVQAMVRGGVLRDR